MRVNFSHVWPYELVDTNQSTSYKRITLAQLKEFADMTGASLEEVFNTLKTLRNAYELGMIDLGDTSNNSPEIAFMKSFMYNSKGQKLPKGFLKELVKQHGGINALAEYVITELLTDDFQCL